MYCENRITHRVQEGDSLYSLSRKYHTTVTELILLNSGVNPYNLQVGMRLIVCPGEGYEEEKKEGSVIVLPIRPPKPQKPGMNNGSNAENSVEEMKNQMRLDWLNHIISVKFYLVSFFENLASQNAWKRAVGQNMDQILSVFEKRFPADTMRRLRGLMEQHLQLTDAVAAELKKNVTYSGDCSAFCQTESGIWGGGASKTALQPSGSREAADGSLFRRGLRDRYKTFHGIRAAYDRTCRLSFGRTSG